MMLALKAKPAMEIPRIAVVLAWLESFGKSALFCGLPVKPQETRRIFAVHK